MTSSRKYVPLVVVLLTATAFSAIPMDVLAADKNMDVVALTNNFDLFVRAPVRINNIYLANETINPPGGGYLNLSGSQIDVGMNYTFVMRVTDQDWVQPNTSYLANLTIVVFMNSEPDPTQYNVSDYRAKYTARNYMFQLKATRISGGGTTPSVWVFDRPFPQMGNNEVLFHISNSSKVNEIDTLKNSAGEIVPGTDGVNDSLEIRWAFSLGEQCRNTNTSGPLASENWEFYGVVGDYIGLENSSKSWTTLAMQQFDVFMKTTIHGSGVVQGADAPGGSPFLLNIGPTSFHTLPYASNNYAWFEVNATNLSTSPQWNSDTLNVSSSPVPIGHANWTAIGPGFKKFTQMDHADNGTNSTSGIPGPGETMDIHAYWMCNGVPLGIPSGKYNSTVTFRIRIPP